MGQLNKVNKSLSSLRIDYEKCTGCGKCAEVCVVDGVVLEYGKAVFNIKCKECGVCVLKCPENALEL
ncbi:MAG: 4Fe-4S dicluster domain-containing protein [Chitinivibrionales bacterium]|nr:4Fe-4S dicluster domain-containing protein [Chitinivibrionales bacterium]